MIADALQHFHLIRPYWLLALIPLALLVWLMLRQHLQSMNWKHVCDAELLPHILTSPGGARNRMPLWLATAAAVLAIVAAAGPAWQQLEQPVFRDQSALVIALDLSQSMDATDIKPTRLSRARLKILDALKLRESGQTALVVYAADAFVVAPLTDDSDTIAHLVPTLETAIMPSQGSNSLSALDEAQRLLRQAGINSGHILLLTDGISETELERFATAIEDGHRVSLIGFGTEQGSPIPTGGGFLTDQSGSIVLPVLQRDRLRQAALAGGGLYRDMRNDDADIEAVLSLMDADIDMGSAEQDLSADSWREEGPWLLLVALPLLALLARRGWLGVMLIAILPLPQEAHALGWEDLWQTPDQRAMQAFEAGDHQSAADTFEDPRWRSSALYREGEYQQMLDTLPEPKDAIDHYNRGNALAKLGELEQALEAYDEALELDPDNEDAAYNRRLIEDALKQQQQEQQNQQGQDQQESNDDSQASDSQDTQQNPEQEQNSQASQQSSEQSDPSSEQTDDSAQQAEESSQQQAEQEETMSQQGQTDAEDSEQQATEAQQAALQEMDEAARATEQWLQRIPDDPGGLLRRKFQYQYNNRDDQNRSQNPW